jgi:hypothetical protein
MRRDALFASAGIHTGTTVRVVAQRSQDRGLALLRRCTGPGEDQEGITTPNLQQAQGDRAFRTKLLLGLLSLPPVIDLLRRMRLVRTSYQQGGCLCSGTCRCLQLLTDVYTAATLRFIRSKQRAEKRTADAQA